MRRWNAGRWLTPLLFLHWQSIRRRKSRSSPRYELRESTLVMWTLNLWTLNPAAPKSDLSLAMSPSMPFIEDETGGRSGRAKAGLLVLASVMAAGVAALAAYHSFVQPLDVLWFRLLRKFG